MNSFPPAGPFLIRNCAGEPEPKIARDLRTLADAALTLRPPSVVDKPHMPPSGDKHDWMNLADYSWPNPDSANGLPYVTRDGQANPEAAHYDRRRFNLFVLSTLRLGAAWQQTGRRDHAIKACEWIRHWFTEPATAMTPHLRYAHHVPGDVPGRMDGLIVFCSALPSVLDVWRLLQQSGNITTPSDNAAMCRWVEHFLVWLQTDTMSLTHASANNNHGTYHEFLVAYLMLFLDRHDAARAEISKSLERRLATQIGESGEQRLETDRTLSAQYSMFNLKALMSLATLGEAVQVDGWQTTSASPAIWRATQFLYTYATGDQPWPFQQIEPPIWWFLAPLCKAANRAYGNRFDVSRIHMEAAGSAVPPEPVVFQPGWELIFAPSHQQHLPIAQPDYRL